MLAGVLDFFWREGFVKALVVVFVSGIFGWQLYYSINLLNDLKPEGARASSYPVTLAEMEQAVDYITNNSGGERFNFICDNYYRSFEYLFDQQGAAVSVTPEVLRYEVVIGGSEGKRFGNLSVLKGIDN